MVVVECCGLVLQWSVVVLSCSGVLLSCLAAFCGVFVVQNKNSVLGVGQVGDVRCKCAHLQSR